MAKIHISQRFGSTPNNLLYNPKISLKAKGLYGYIQAKPDDWNFSAQRICLECKEAIDSIRLALKELEDFGYLIRQKAQNNKGHWEIDYILLSEPILKNPTLENPTLENPTSENTPNNKKKDLKNNINNNNIVDVSEKEFSSPQQNFSSPELFPNETRVNTSYDFGENAKKVAQKKVEDSDASKKTLFRNSDVYKMVNFEDKENPDYSKFENLYNTEEFRPIDLIYYFHTVSDWSDTKNMKRTKKGWEATIRNFIRGDIDKNKVKLKAGFNPNKSNDDEGYMNVLTGNF